MNSPSAHIGSWSNREVSASMPQFVRVTVPSKVVIDIPLALQTLVPSEDHRSRFALQEASEPDCKPILVLLVEEVE